MFIGDGALGVWKGVPIAHHAFAYALGNALTFHGTLMGNERIAGTFKFYTPSAGRTPACTTGTVRWTARVVS